MSVALETSRIPNFYQLSAEERWQALFQHGWINKSDYMALMAGKQTLSHSQADKMIENVVGVLGLPNAVALNFLINQKEQVVPLAVEEPSIVAALSYAAKIARAGGGFSAQSDKPLLIGQVQLLNLTNISRAEQAINSKKTEILNLANCLQPNMVARGGGAVALETTIHSNTKVGNMLVVHLFVDTCDAMGANMVNSICEGVAPLIQQIAGGEVCLRILSNLTDKALVRAKVCIPLQALNRGQIDPIKVRDGIVAATELARVCPYRAATHNKGIMNGIDAVAIATGNDWRAIEAAAHAYAASDGQYRSLSSWTATESGDLLGEMVLPLKVGIVGGSIENHPMVAMNHRILGVTHAAQLAEIMACVGLAQNFAALRALVSDGIQQGHMSLHARSVVQAAGAPAEMFETIVKRVIDSGEIKIWKAKQIIEELKDTTRARPPVAINPVANSSVGHGKVILLGEHAVVYGRSAIAAPIPLAIEADIKQQREGVSLCIPQWGIAQKLKSYVEKPQFFEKTLGYVLDSLKLMGRAIQINVYPNLPRAMGLGSSAAIAVAIIRALDNHFKLGLTDDCVNTLAFECEKISHQTPSGIDNTVATFGHTILYRNQSEPSVTPIHLQQPISMVLATVGKENLTAKMLANVKQLWQRNTRLCERIFDEINELTLQGVDAIESYALEQLGDLMNVCHGLLNSLGVSSTEVEHLVKLARLEGALGAKLTGSGAGAIIALCPDNPERVVKAVRQAGYQAMPIEIAAP